MWSCLWRMCIIILVVLTCLAPASGSYFSMLVLSISSFISLPCLYYLFVYYYNLPLHSQNVLIFLTQLLIYIHALCVLQEFAINILLQCFKNQLTDFVENNFHLTCYLWRIMNFRTAWFVCIVEIMAFKTLLIRAPVKFLQMNRIAKCICLIFPGVVYVIMCLDLSCKVSNSVDLHVLYNVTNIDIRTKQEQSFRLNPAFLFLIILFCIEFYNNFIHDNISWITYKCSTQKQTSICMKQLDGDTTDRSEVITIDTKTDTGRFSQHSDVNTAQQISALNQDIHEDVTNNSKPKTPVSYRFVLIMAALGSLINMLRTISNNQRDDCYIISWTILALVRFMVFNAPLLWILSHRKARKFMQNRLKQNMINVTQAMGMDITL